MSKRLYVPVAAGAALPDNGVIGAYPTQEQAFDAMASMSKLGKADSFEVLIFEQVDGEGEELAEEMHE